MKKYIVTALALLIAFSACAFAAVLPDWAKDALQIPDTITLIEANAFEEGIGADGVVIPSSVTSIQTGAFINCENVKRICVLSTSVKLAPGSLGEKSDTREIWGYAGSTAEAYAKEYGYTFVSISSDIEQLLAYADSLVGQPYVHGKLDCILFVRKCYLDVLHIKIPDTTRAMQNFGSSSLAANLKVKPKLITKISELKPGDVICWRDDKNSYCTHVGMYVGAGKIGSTRYSSGVFVDASASARKVRYNYIPATGTGWYTRNFLCAWRILN